MTTETTTPKSFVIVHGDPCVHCDELVTRDSRDGMDRWLSVKTGLPSCDFNDVHEVPADGDDEDDFYGLHDCDPEGKCGCEYQWNCECQSCAVRFAENVLAFEAMESLRATFRYTGRILRVGLRAALRRRKSA